MSPEWLALAAGFFAVAALYASVGFGGGSSYLALLALVLAGDTALMRSTALLCNLAVVSGSTWLYARGGHIAWRRALPFVALSVPAAYLGATVRLDDRAFFLLLGATLLAAAALLAWRALRGGGAADLAARASPTWTAPALGAGIGGLAGAVGIGGGIFLAPVLHHLRWARPLEIAALASLFILVNSAAGLLGLATSGQLRVDAWGTPLCLLAVIAGGQLGVRLALRRLSGRAIRLVTAALVGAVGVRMLLVHLGG